MTVLIAAGFTDNFAGSLRAIWEFFRTGGWFMLPIVLCWFVSIAVIILKLLDLRRHEAIPESLVAGIGSIDSTVESGRFASFLTGLDTNPSPLSRICRAALSGRHPDKESASRSAEATAREEVSRMERGIPLLEIIFTISPMLGLIGTASGLVRIFSSFGGASPDAGQAREIALGIAEAMNTTIAGLVVAVPALVAQVLFSRRVEALALRMATLVSELLDSCWFHDSGTGTRKPAPVPVPTPEPRRATR